MPLTIPSFDIELTENHVQTLAAFFEKHNLSEFSETSDLSITDTATAFLIHSAKYYLEHNLFNDLQEHIEAAK